MPKQRGYPSSPARGYLQEAPRGYFQGRPLPHLPPPEYPPRAQPQEGATPYPEAEEFPPKIPYGGGDDDDDDLAMVDLDVQEVEPSAPPLSNMDTIQGYNSTNFDGVMAPPPSYEEAIQSLPPERSAVDKMPVISEYEARKALLEFVAENCCYGKGTAQNMYTLETFSEGRRTFWDYVPFTGQRVDGPENGIPPGPWDIERQPLEHFRDDVLHVEVPHTASVKVCHGCKGRCKVVCSRCHREGQVRCTSCNGRGHKSRHGDGGRLQKFTCESCQGSGRVRCQRCKGSGQVKCRKCQARGKVKWFIKLAIEWTNHLNDFIEEKTALPDDLIRRVSGRTAFEETAPTVWPVTHFPDPSINQASQQLVQQHRTAFPTERILMQRHRVRVVPVTELSCRNKDETFRYFVYGFENKVHAPDYPQQCCWGCTIL